MKSDDQLIEELKKATEGLLFMSESDYPFETICWKGLLEVSTEFLRTQAELSVDAPVETISLDDFFQVAASDAEWRSTESRQAALKYRKLIALLKENLDNVKVYKLGRVNMPVYIVGQSKTGNWLGISTRVVET
jgi:Nuclease A inhibitor-like protein